MFFSSGPLLSILLVAARHSTIGYRFSWSAQSVFALVAGVLILVRPKLLNYIVAIYLILVGITGILHLSW